MTKEQPQRNAALKEKNLQELEQFAVSIGEARFRGKQLFKWLYGKGATSFDEMTDLPLTLRRRLGEMAFIDTIQLVTMQTARDKTMKCLYRLRSGREVEAVLIPDFEEDGTPKRLTVCVSSQVGCAMACSFCATGLMGFQQNLTAGEIFDQVWQMNRLALERFQRPITNIVFMGMGEPLLNYDAVLKSIEIITHPDGAGLSPKRITVSTVGLAKRIKQLADDETRFNLAISLHAPSSEKRSSIMPVNRAAGTDLEALKQAVQYYFNKTGRRVTYEYCMFQEFNDTPEDARKLAEIVKWAPSKVNLIMFNQVEGVAFKRTEEPRLNRFIQVLVDHDVNVTVRRSRGQDIAAACGQLAASHDQA